MISNTDDIHIQSNTFQIIYSVKKNTQSNLNYLIPVKNKKIKKLI